MRKMERLYKGLWEDDGEKLVEIMQELIDLASDNPVYLTDYLIKEARKSPDRKYKLIFLMENLGLEEANDFIEETLKPRENYFIGLQLSVEKAIKNGWKNDEKIAVLEKNIEIDAQTEKYGYKGYSIQLSLDNSSRIIGIKKLANNVVGLDDDMLKLGELLDKATRCERDCGELPYFPLLMHARYMKAMEELV